MKQPQPEAGLTANRALGQLLSGSEVLAVDRSRQVTAEAGAGVSDAEAHHAAGT